MDTRTATRTAARPDAQSPPSKRANTATDPTDSTIWNLGGKLADYWLKDEKHDNTANGVRCAFNACCTVLRLKMHNPLDEQASAIELALSSMPYKDPALWYSAKGTFYAYYVKEKCSVTKQMLLVDSDVAAKAKANRVAVKVLKDSEGPDEWAALVNADVAAATDDEIKELVNADGMEDVSSVIVAAEVIERVYAAGYEFAEGMTEEKAAFRCLDGSGGVCHLMRHEKNAVRMPYLELESGQVALLPTCEENKDGPQDTAWKLIFLPKAKADDPKCTDEAWLRKGAEEVVASMQTIVDVVRNPSRWTWVSLRLPRAEAKTKAPVDITTMLADSGWGWLFENGSLARGLKTSDGETVPQSVGKAVMMTMYRGHERGFKAAAAVALIVYRSMGAYIEEPEPDVEVHCNRAFAMHIIKLPSSDGSPSDLTPPHILYSMNVTNDSTLKDAKSAADLFD